MIQLLTMIAAGLSVTISLIACTKRLAKQLWHEHSLTYATSDDSHLRSTSI
jgi:hypothetical protein